MSNSTQALNPELDLIRQFIQSCAPFDVLSPEDFEYAISTMNIAYYRQGHLFRAQEDKGDLRIIRSGAAELRGPKGQLMDRFDEGTSFNLLGLSQEDIGISVALIEDCLIYSLPEESYQTIRANNRDFDRFFRSQRNRRLRRAARHETQASELASLVKDVMSQTIVSIGPEKSIAETARLMTKHRISSALIICEGKLLGIVTDRDIRSRAVAKNSSLDNRVDTIMTKDPSCISPQKTLFDATLQMTQEGYHHLPVVEDDVNTMSGKIKGIITASDLMLARQDDPIYLVQHINRQHNLEELKSTVAQLPSLMIQWTHAGIRAAQVASIFTAISDAVTAQLIKLFIQEQGPAPAAFAWLGFGSQGRAEQLLGGDQDNALLIDNSAQQKDEVWFKNLAHWVCDGLNECGYIYCPGKIMATTDEWRKNLDGWRSNIDQWVRTPSPDAVMRVSIFFDIRVVYGDKQLGKNLHDYMLKKASADKIFLGALADNVLDNTPPLGLFRQFVVESDGEHSDELNLKKRGILPIIDIARIHSLASQSTAVNTLERLDKLVTLKLLTINESRNLQDALNIIMQIRLKEQVKELATGENPNNYINPDDLSELSRKQLKDAFSVIRDAQQGIKMRYRPGL